MRDVISLKDSLTHIEKTRVDNLSMAGTAAVVRVKEHISKGKNADGRAMISKSSKKEGRYSKVYGKKRKARGLITSVINLAFRGDTINAFKRQTSLASFKNDEVIIGIADEELEQIAIWNNEMFDNPYDLSERELEEVFTTYIDEFKSDLLR